MHLMCWFPLNPKQAPRRMVQSWHHHKSLSNHLYQISPSGKSLVEARKPFRPLNENKHVIKKYLDAIMSTWWGSVVPYMGPIAPATSGHLSMSRHLVHSTSDSSLYINASRVNRAEFCEMPGDRRSWMISTSGEAVQLTGKVRNQGWLTHSIKNSHFKSAIYDFDTPWDADTEGADRFRANGKKLYWVQQNCLNDV